MDENKIFYHLTLEIIPDANNGQIFFINVD